MTRDPEYQRGWRAISSPFSCPQMGEAGDRHLRQAVAMIKTSLATASLYALALLLGAPSAHAQSAEQYNRASQAIQLCSSAQGALIPECAKLRGTYGAPTLGGGSGGGLGALSGLGSLGGFKGMGSAGKAAGIANLLGSAMSQVRSAAPAQTAAPATNTSMIQQAITDCVRNAAGNNAMIQGCLAIAADGVPVPR